ncbi:MAG: nickel pincer cofactor biosynthesis protein LarC [Anaerolineae bacterium]|nr:nickel pincer cofactor biosynthesis protein LarC [Anaerolineae bacterium]
MRVLYCDCFSGISGDMFLAGMLDAGMPLEYLREALRGLRLPEFLDVGVQETRKGTLRAALLQFQIEEHDHPHRNLADIVQLIESSRLPASVQQTSLAIFQKLAEAEARVHGEEIHQVHFHEVGAVDSILDIVGAAVGLHYFEIDQLYASVLPLGSGKVDTAHGVLPVPSPATLELLRAAQAPLVPSALEVELVTPTGAAILSALARFEQPQMTLRQVGVGAGRRELPWPNILRVLVGEWESPQPTHVEIETNIDDMNPQFYGYVMEKLFAAGALDVTITPVLMKKNRPASRLSVIANKKDERALADVLLRETTTLGVRVIPLTRYEAAREIHKIQTPFGEVEVKIKRMGGAPPQVAPEYDSCVELARASGRPLNEVYWVARESAMKVFGLDNS